MNDFMAFDRLTLIDNTLKKTGEMKREKHVNRRHLKYSINFVYIGLNVFYLFAFSLFFYNYTSFIFFSPHMAMSLDFQGI